MLVWSSVVSVAVVSAVVVASVVIVVTIVVLLPAEFAITDLARNFIHLTLVSKLWITEMSFLPGK